MGNRVPPSRLQVRAVETLHTVSSMVTAWCMLYAAEWMWQDMGSEGITTGVPGRVGIALSVSAVACALIYMLDKVLRSPGVRLPRCVWPRVSARWPGVVVHRRCIRRVKPGLSIRTQIFFFWVKDSPYGQPPGTTNRQPPTAIL